MYILQTCSVGFLFSLGKSHLFWDSPKVENPMQQICCMLRHVLQCVAVCCSVLQCVAACCSMLQCVAVCCSVLQCVAVCCSMAKIFFWGICQKAKDRFKKCRFNRYGTTNADASGMEWLRLVGSLGLWVSFTEYSLFYMALLQKRPITLRCLLIVATPYGGATIGGLFKFLCLFCTRVTQNPALFPKISTN